MIKLKADGCQDASVAHRECWLLIRRREGEVPAERWMKNGSLVCDKGERNKIPD